MTPVYVVGYNTGWFRLMHLVDDHAFVAPTVWSWRVYGPPVALPAGALSGDSLEAWVNSLTARGCFVRSVTAGPGAA